MLVGAQGIDRSAGESEFMSSRSDYSKQLYEVHSLQPKSFSKKMPSVYGGHAFVSKRGACFPLDMSNPPDYS